MWSILSLRYVIRCVRNTRIRMPTYGVQGDGGHGTRHMEQELGVSHLVSGTLHEGTRCTSGTHRASRDGITRNASRECVIDLFSCQALFLGNTIVSSDLRLEQTDHVIKVIYITSKHSV